MKKIDPFNIAGVIIIFVATIFILVGAFQPMIDFSSDLLVSVLVVGLILVILALVYVYFKGDFKS